MGDYPLTDWDSQAKLVQMTGMPLSSRFFFCACICPLNIAMPQTNGKNLKTWDYSPLNPDKPIYSQHLLRCLIDRGVVLDGSYPLREAARRHGPHESANLSSIGLGKWPNISPTWKVRLHSSELAVRSWKKNPRFGYLLGHTVVAGDFEDLEPSFGLLILTRSQFGCWQQILKTEGPLEITTTIHFTDSDGLSFEDVRDCAVYPLVI